MLCQGSKIAQYVRDIEALPNFIGLSLAEKGGTKYKIFKPPLCKGRRHTAGSILLASLV